ncbi:MAG TPA: hypothetical protein ENK44_00385 [Caldithrix abyssi]|uniref:Outer membrane protein beta-barrel domain-containing protein n=1 Tax=Caldithrix abyssi TaxID=187145 RepID=A0A7V4TYR2_CALAY|nr:hypothetical protein [Caldithrix abyssi]
MNHKILTVFFLLFLFCGLSARESAEFSLGINASHLQSTQKDNGFQIGFDYFYFMDKSYFVTAGLRYEENRFFVENLPVQEIYLDDPAYSGKIRVQNVKETNRFVTVSILAGFALPVKDKFTLQLSAGLYYAALIDRRSKEETIERIEDEPLPTPPYYQFMHSEPILTNNKDMYGLEIRGELVISKISLVARYAYSFNTRDVVGKVHGFKGHLQVFALSLGFYFL